MYFNRQKCGWNRAYYGQWSSPVFLTSILKYRLDRQLNERRSSQKDSLSYGSNETKPLRKRSSEKIPYWTKNELERA